MAQGPEALFIPFIPCFRQDDKSKLDECASYGDFMLKSRVFRLHFNRFNAKRTAKDVWTVHLSDRCIQTRQVEVRVPVQTVYKGDSAPQPRAFLRGKGIVRVSRNKVVIV